MLRTEPTAEDSLALILARSRFGIAIAAMIKMIATTISSSISEKPFCLRISLFFPLLKFFESVFESRSQRPDASYLRIWLAIAVNYQSQRFSAEQPYRLQQLTST